MNYNLISKLIFQDFLKKNIECITSTTQLKMYIIAFLVEGSYSYTDSDVDQLVIDVMKFLTVEDSVSATQSPIITEEADINNIIASINERLAVHAKTMNDILCEYDSGHLVEMCEADDDFDSITDLVRDLYTLLDIEDED